MLAICGYVGQLIDFTWHATLIVLLILRIRNPILDRRELLESRLARAGERVGGLGASSDE